MTSVGIEPTTASDKLSCPAQRDQRLRALRPCVRVLVGACADTTEILLKLEWPCVKESHGQTQSTGALELVLRGAIHIVNYLLEMLSAAHYKAEIWRPSPDRPYYSPQRSDDSWNYRKLKETTTEQTQCYS